MEIILGKIRNFMMEKYDSQFKVPSTEVFFCDDLANLYKPIIYGADFPDPEPVGIYYRIMLSPGLNRLCIQYYVYWLDQDCLDILPIADHKYDYEPILIFIDLPQEFPVGIVNAGFSSSLGLTCRFHKTEIRLTEFVDRDFKEYQFRYKTSPAPSYPFGGQAGLIGSTCIKKYPISGAIYLKDLHPMFGITSCSHVFSGAEKALHGRIMSLPINRLDDQILHEWYFEHYDDENEEPFGHDVSDPFTFPHIKYCDPKPVLRSQS